MASAVQMGNLNAVIEAAKTGWSIYASINEQTKSSAMEERIHTLESVITIHQFIIGMLSTGLVVLFTYILLRKH